MTITPWSTTESVISAAPEGVTVAVAAHDLRSDQHFDHLGDAVLPPASTIKILILASLAQAVDAGVLELDQRVSVLPEQRSAGSGVLNELQTPFELSLSDHARLMITISDNTASNVLIDAVGKDAIAATAQNLGLNSASINRRFIGRRPDPGTPENEVSANDLVTILAAIANDTAASPPLCQWMRETLAGQHYLDRLPRNLPLGVAFAGKSGSLEGVTHDCGILSSEKGTMAVAVLTQGFSDKYEADEFIGRVGAAVVADAGLE